MHISIGNVNESQIEYNSPTRIENGMYEVTPTERILVEVRKVKAASTVDDMFLINLENTPNVEFIRSIEKQCIQSATDNSHQWFSKSLPHDAVEEMCQKSITFADNNDHIFRVEPNKKKVVVYNVKKESVELEEVKENCLMSTLLEVKGVVFLKKSFYIKWILHQIKLERPKKHDFLKEYAFQHDSESGDSE